jgi:spore coat polysaccharide biosynthesis protein SpsF
MIGAIIQARMTSTRLPGKVLMPINGRPVIEYLFAQLKHVQKLDTIVLATTTNKEDDPLVKYAKANGYNYYRGSEHDVLERYYNAAKQYNIHHILRVTADCSLIGSFNM